MTPKFNLKVNRKTNTINKNTNSNLIENLELKAERLLKNILLYAFRIIG